MEAITAEGVNSVFRVLIVDRDTKFTEKLLNLIDWERNGFAIIAVELLGTVGLNRFYSYKPDIVLLGMELSIMTGLDFVEKVKNVRHPFHILLMDYGDNNIPELPVYCKYMDKNKLTPQCFLDLLNEESNELSYSMQTSKKFKKEVFEELISVKSISEYNSLVAGYQLNLQLGYLNIVLIDIGNRGDDKTKHLLLKKLNGILQDLHQGELFLISENEICLLTNYDKNSIVSQLATVRQAIRDCLYGTSKLYIAENISPVKLESTYKDLKNLIKYEYFTAGQDVISKQMILKRYDDVSMEELELLCNTLIVDVIFGEKQDVIGTLEQLYLETLKYSMDWNLCEIADKQVQLCFELVSLLLVSTVPDECLTKGSFKTIEEKYNYIKEKYLELQNKIQETIKGINPIVSQALRMICTQYDQNLSLESAATSIGVSKGYLSSLFKNDMQLGFSDCLTQYRMIVAKHHLRNGSMVKKIGILIGLLDPKYFSRVFKKWIGMSPRTYQERYVSDSKNEGGEHNEGSLSS